MVANAKSEARHCSFYSYSLLPYLPDPSIIKSLLQLSRMSRDFVDSSAMQLAGHNLTARAFRFFDVWRKKDS